jgi:hypothetical protein
VPGWYELFPMCVCLPLLFIVWSLVNHRAGRPNFGRVGLVLLCLAGVGGTLFILLVASLKYAFICCFTGNYVLPSIDETLLLGFWTCAAGYGLLIVGALLFGYPFGVPRRRAAQ